jgi:hypothetical protein
MSINKNSETHFLARNEHVEMTVEGPMRKLRSRRLEPPEPSSVVYFKGDPWLCVDPGKIVKTEIGKQIVGIKLRRYLKPGTA